MKAIRIVTCLFLFLSLGCKKDHGVLDPGVQPGEDLVNVRFSDTCKVYAHTITYDSIPSFNDRIKFLGTNQDPVFGRTDVSLYTNINIPNDVTNINFGGDAVLTKAEIKLVLGEEYVGDFNTPLVFSVYQVTTALATPSVYYTKPKNWYDSSVLLGSYTGTYNVENGLPVVTIPIDSNFGTALLTNTTALENTGTLQAYIKGFYITTESSGGINPSSLQGAIYRMDTDADGTGLFLTYSNPSQTVTPAPYRFSFSGSQSVRFNTVKYQPTLSGNQILNKQIVDKDSTFGQQDLFLKGLGGTRLRLYIPGLKNFEKDTTAISVNRAELELKVDPSFTNAVGLYAAPPKLALIPVDDAGNETLAVDQLTANDLSRYDGNYDPIYSRYVFNIARHVQAIMRGQKKNLGFHVVVADPNPIYTARRDNYAFRIVLAGTASNSYKPVFRLSYVPLKKE